MYPDQKPHTHFFITIYYGQFHLCVLSLQINAFGPIVSFAQVQQYYLTN